MSRLAQQIEFIIEIEKLKAIYRKTWLPCDNDRNENSAEHSWQVALAANILCEYASVEIDIVHVTKMLLLHDVVEIYAGDTFAYASNEVLYQSQYKPTHSLFAFHTSFNPLIFANSYCYYLHIKELN